MVTGGVIQKGDEGSGPSFPRRVRGAILVIDVVESVRLMDHHEAEAVSRWQRFVEQVRTDVLPRHGLRLVKALGDGLRLLAPDVPAALAAAQDILALVPEYNEGRDADALLRLHTGLHLAEVTEDAIDIYGRGVNLAARLAQQSEPGEILMSADVQSRLVPGLDPATVDLGERWVKGLDAPVRMFRVATVSEASREILAPPAPPRGFRPSIALLPFLSDEASGSAAPLGALLTDDLTCALSALEELQVVSRLSSNSLAERGLGAAASAPLVHAAFLLSGSVRRLGDQLVVHAELFDAGRCEVIHRMRESAPLSALVAEESPLVAALTAGITTAILQRTVALARRSALPNLDGYALLLGGIALMHRLSRQDFFRARELLAHLAERWPRLATPRAWLARWHLFKVLQRWSDDADADRRQALESSQRAIDLDPDSSVALAVAGSVRIGLSQDVDSGIELYDRALSVNPNDSFAWMLRGTAHAFRGDGGDAVRNSSQAQSLSPLDPMRFLYDCHAAAAALAADDVTRARALAERSLHANAQHLSTYRVLAIAQMLDGDGAAARDTVRRLLTLDPQASVEGYLRSSPGAAYPFGQRLARLLAEAGLPR